MKVMIYSDNGLEYCKDKLEKLFHKIEIENSHDEDYPFGEKIEVDINSLDTLNDILSINGYAHLWKESVKSKTDFFIDLTEPSMS